MPIKISAISMHLDRLIEGASAIEGLSPSPYRLELHTHWHQLALHDEFIKHSGIAVMNPELFYEKLFLEWSKFKSFY